VSPRLPVDGKKVVEHRVTLGSYEREQLDTLVTGVTVKNVTTPLVALLSDVSAMVALAAILEALGIIDLTGLAKKLYGQGLAWMEEVKAGIYGSLDDAIAGWNKKIEDFYPDWAPGGTPLIDAYVPPEEYTLSTSDRAWAMTQIYSQQQTAEPAYPGQGYRGYEGA